MVKVEKLDWEQIKKYAQSVAEELVRSRYKPEVLVGISAGGLIPTTFMSHFLNNKNIVTVAAYSYKDKKSGNLTVLQKPGKGDLEGKKILLIDDIADTGETMIKVRDMLLNEYGAKDVKTAVLLLKKEKCKIQPDFWAAESDAWVEFPWEVDEI